MIVGLLADIASIVALAISLAALWRSYTILRRLRERDQQTNFFFNFRRNERILRESILRADVAESLEFFAALERCKADAEELAGFRRSKISAEAGRLRRRIRRLEAMFWLAGTVRAAAWQNQLCIRMSRAVSHFTQQLENEERRLQAERRYAGHK
jgi:hypothetical protein